MLWNQLMYFWIDHFIDELMSLKKLSWFLEFENEMTFTKVHEQWQLSRQTLDLVLMSEGKLVKEVSGCVVVFFCHVSS